jgi:WD40 repeat protein
MSKPVPHFELRRVHDDGTTSEPLLIPLKEMVHALSGSRRAFLAAGVTASAVLGHLPSQVQAQGPAAKVLPRAHAAAIRDLAISPDGTYLATTGEPEVKVWSLAEKSLVATEVHPSSAYTSVAFGAEDLLYVGDGAGSIQLRMESRGWLAEASADLLGDSVNDLLAVDGGKQMVAAGADGNVAWLDGESLAETQMQRHAAGAVCLATDAARKWVASGDTAGDIQLWSVDGRKALATMTGHVAVVTHLDFRADGSSLISRSNDNTLKLWRMPSGELQNTLTGKWSSVENMRLAPNGKFLLTSTGKMLQMWRLSNGESLGVLNGHRARVTALAIGTDNTLAVSGDEDGVVIVWNLRDRKAVSFLFDPAASDRGSGASSINGIDSEGRTITFTLPCGSPIPAGAVCTCNCVPGALEIVRPQTQSVVVETEVQRQRREELEMRRIAQEEERQRKKEETEIRRYEKESQRLERIERRRYGKGYIPAAPSGGGGGMICTCDLIEICHAQQLASADSRLRDLAEQLLLAKGQGSLAYLKWSLTMSTGSLRRTIAEQIERIHHGVRPAMNRWPTRAFCRDLLGHGNDVAATMGAQALALGWACGLSERSPLREAEWRRVDDLLDAARARPWYVRYGVRC